ncbi:MAG: PadR family transcriptional regulator [Candidatus Bathyarchaeota archaeon]|nr:PadR family transcriptional regulator [Candidatus Bathyarchaeota archaeon]
MSIENCSVCPPNCCDMRGMLSFMILWLLSKRPMYGQELANEIGKRKGTIPNSGTIYPALKELKKKNLIESDKKGRITTYTITEEGKKGFKLAYDYFFKAFGEIFLEQTKII